MSRRPVWLKLTERVGATYEDTEVTWALGAPDGVLVRTVSRVYRDRVLTISEALAYVPGVRVVRLKNGGGVRLKRT